MGTPYQWGGYRQGGFDCSGLVYAAYRAAGYTGIGRTTYDQIKQGVAVSRGGLRPGDIVFPHAGHEGLYIGNGMVIEAPHTGSNVKIIPLSSFGFWQARRLIGGGGGVVPPRYVGGQSRAGLPIPHTPGIPAFDPKALARLGQQQMQTAMMGAKAQSMALLKQLTPPKLQTVDLGIKNIGDFDLSHAPTGVPNMIQQSQQLVNQYHVNALDAAGITRKAPLLQP